MKLFQQEVENGNNLYSLEEETIGTWIDGKKIYRKTVVFEKNKQEV